MGVRLYVICSFSLIAFNILPLPLIFDKLITMCLGVFLVGFILPGTLCFIWTWLIIDFPMLEKFSAIIQLLSLQVFFSSPFSLRFPQIPGKHFLHSAGYGKILPAKSCQDA